MNAQSPRGLNSGDRAVLFSALFWGTIWWPIRAVDEAAGGAGEGGAGSLPMLLSYIIATAVMAPFMVRSFGRIRADWVRWTGIGVLGGAAYVLYAEALLTGNVARVIVLFYLMPVWAALLERALLGQKITRTRAAALALGLGGLAVIAGPSAVQGALTAADVTAVVSGMVFSGALLLINRTPELPSGAKTGAVFLFAVPVFVLVCFAPGGSPAPEINAAVFTAVSPEAWLWLVLHAAVWLTPGFWLSIYGAGLTQAGRAAVFFMAEVLIGIVTAALFAGEVISAHEAVGAVLVVSAGLAEALAPSKGPAGEPAREPNNGPKNPPSTA